MSKDRKIRWGNLVIAGAVAANLMNPVIGFRSARAMEDSGALVGGGGPVNPEFYPKYERVRTNGYYIAMLWHRNDSKGAWLGEALAFNGSIVLSLPKGMEFYRVYDPQIAENGSTKYDVITFVMGKPGQAEADMTISSILFKVDKNGCREIEATLGMSRVGDAYPDGLPPVRQIGQRA